MPSLNSHTNLQGDFLDKLAELIVKTYGPSNNIHKEDVYFIGEEATVLHCARVLYKLFLDIQLPAGYQPQHNLIEGVIIFTHCSQHLLQPRVPSISISPWS